jgi:hypothetical protein
LNKSLSAPHGIPRGLGEPIRSGGSTNAAPVEERLDELIVLSPVSTQALVDMLRHRMTLSLMFIEVLEQFVGRVTLYGGIVVELASLATQTAPRTHEKDGQLSISCTPTSGIGFPYFVIDPDALFEQVVVECVSHAMASGSMLIEVLHHRISGFHLGPVVLAEATSNADQPLDADAPDDCHIAGVVVLVERSLPTDQLRQEVLWN